MASQIRKKNTSVIRRLISQPHRFTFYQAVRLLIAAGGAESLGVAGNHIGTTKNASEEPIRFRSNAALEFPAAEIVSIEVSDSSATSISETDVDNATIPIRMEVAFWGLVGPLGVLPNHYTQLMIDRIHQKDPAFRDFLDLFSHRQLSLFYRAWEKHFVSAGFERAVRNDNPAMDMLRESLLALVGRGTKRVRDRLEILDDVNIYYGGLFSDRPNAESLGQMVADYLALPAKILSLFGQWLWLPPTEKSRIGVLGGHSMLGVDTVLGDRVWDPTSKFRIQIGPVGYQDFSRLMPTGDQLVPISQLIRSYVGCEFSFDLQVILRAPEVPACQLGTGASGDVSANLGWNTWLCSRPMRKDVGDAVFQHDGAPL